MRPYQTNLILMLANGPMMNIKDFQKVCKSMEKTGTLYNDIFKQDPVLRQDLMLKSFLEKCKNKDY